MALACVANLLVLVLAVSSSPLGVVSIHRNDFDSDFIFGVATSSYQYEGAYNESKGFTIWDNFTHTQPGKIADKSNGDVALDSYRRYKRDVVLAKNLGVDAYRLSIAWARILPKGHLAGGVNEEGVEHYNKLINELLSKGLKPFVTLFHWDLPEALEDEYGGFLNRSIVKDFVDYASICFEKFGDRVKHWITFNEPLIFVSAGFDSGIMAPGRCGSRQSCTAGNSGTEPYLVGHHLLLAHAAAVKLYRDRYQKVQKGTIGITQTTTWFLPLGEFNKSDSDATQRAIDFNYGWFMDPIVYGDYPFIMRAIVGDRLPEFTAQESELLRGSYDFIGINYYTTSYVYAVPHSTVLGAAPSYSTDSYMQMTYFRNNIPIGPVAGSSWLYIYPKGIKELVMYTKEKYNDPIIYITENGVDELNASVPLSVALRDKMRIDYYRDHLYYLHKAIRDGARVKGYFMWTLMDDFEWFSGYTIRFGLYYVDFKGLKIYPKDSVYWFRRFFNLI